MDSSVPWMAAGSICAGYLAILLVPGPNMLLVAAVSASHGLRRALPVAVAIALGASMLAVLLSLGIAAGGALIPDARVQAVLSAVTLCGTAWYIFRSRPCAAASGGATRAPELIVAFACAFSNPVTAAYFTGAFFASSLAGFDLMRLGLLVMGCVLIIASSVFMAMGYVFAHSAIGDLVVRHGRSIRAIMSSVLLLLALRALTPVMSTASAAWLIRPAM